MKPVLGSCLTSANDKKKENLAKRKVISDNNNGGELVMTSQECGQKQVEEASNTSVVSNVSDLTRNKYENDVLDRSLSSFSPRSLTSKR